jgi:peptidylprolyl isomerase
MFKFHCFVFASLLGVSMFLQGADAFASSQKTSIVRSPLRSFMSLSSTDNPTTAQDNMRQTVRNIVNFGLSSSAIVGLSNVALADATMAAPAKEAPVVDADGFITTDSGLKYRDTKVGDGDMPYPGDTVRVHYTGWLDDFESEKKFDSSYDRRSPLVFKVGVKQVIAGWDEALLTNMKVGGKRDIIIPSQLGYGSRGAGGVIPPNATLYFKIELVGLGNKANR